jgi:transposase
VSKRLQAVVLNSQGLTSGQLSAILHTALEGFRMAGTLSKSWREGLLEGQRSGRLPQLSPSQRQQLGIFWTAVRWPMVLDTGIWTSPMIAWVIEEEFGVQYHPAQVRKLLHE